MTCAPAPPVSSSARTISAEWCAPVIPATATTVSATAAERSRTAWVAAPASYYCTVAVAVVVVDVAQLVLHSPCADVDECADRNSSACTQLCVNSVGSFRCECEKGFFLERDGRTCTKGERGENRSFIAAPPPFLSSQVSFHIAPDLQLAAINELHVHVGAVLSLQYCDSQLGSVTRRVQPREKKPSQAVVAVVEFVFAADLAANGAVTGCRFATSSHELWPCGVRNCAAGAHLAALCPAASEPGGQTPSPVLFVRAAHWIGPTGPEASSKSGSPSHV